MELNVKRESFEHDYFQQNKHSIISKITARKDRRRFRLDSDGRSTGSDDGNESYTSKHLLTTKEEQCIKTLKWLEENFTRCPGVCLPRCIMYAHYLSFCQERKYRPACAATFGKIIRQKFPELTTRRLGTRGNSKYHYYGVAIKESSIYYHTVYTGGGLTRFSGSRLLTEDHTSRKIISSVNSGTLLPEFPSSCQLTLPPNIDSTKLETFLLMYRTHCQCILDTAVSKNFKGIHDYVVNFWQSNPKHLQPLFHAEEVVNLICICDSTMYMVLNDIVVPVSLEDVTTEGLTHVQEFADSFEHLISDALKDHNPLLLERKLEVARRLILGVRRQISFLQLVISFRKMLPDDVIPQDLIEELQNIDIKSIGAQAMYTTVDCTKDQADLHEQYLRELRELLQSNGNIETYIEWLEGIFKKQVLKNGEQDFIAFKLQAQQFLLSWSFFGTRLTHMLTINNSRTYGTFHLIRMMLDEYLLLITETKINKEAQKQLQKSTERLFKGNGSTLPVVTKSKFGIPTKQPYRLKSRTENKNNIPLPPISSLNFPSNINTLRNNNNMFQANDVALNNLVNLTPPSSPVSNEQQVVEQNENRTVTSNSTENVSSLVDEHFRNCGVSEFTTDNRMSSDEILQKFLNSQNDALKSYDISDDVYLNNSSDTENENDISPLQCSFSQILNSDTLFDGLLTDDTSMPSSTESDSNGFNLSNFLSFMENIVEQPIDQNLFQSNIFNEVI